MQTLAKERVGSNVRSVSSSLLEQVARAPLDRRHLYRSRNLSPLVLTGTMPGRTRSTTTSTVENYAGFPEGVDGYELMVRMQKQAERFGARIKILQASSKSSGFFQATLRPVGGRRKGRSGNFDHRDGRGPSASRPGKRTFTGEKRRDLLRHLRWSVADVPQSTARRGRRR